MRWVLVLPILMITTAVPAQSPKEMRFQDEVRARQSLMHIYSFNLGLLSAFAKGEEPYVEAEAVAAANNLAAAAKMDTDAMWPVGSDALALSGGTRAKVEIWSDLYKFDKSQQELIRATNEMAAVAGRGVDDVRGAMVTVADACKGCHEPYRVPRS